MANFDLLQAVLARHIIVLIQPVGQQRMQPLNHFLGHTAVAHTDLLPKDSLQCAVGVERLPLLGILWRLLPKYFLNSIFGERITLDSRCTTYLMDNLQAVDLIMELRRQRRAR
ncbi:hypothetical protein SDC9_151927 [bioreactor metagenome]|uniref:Uncharacterized protein n=1 Tax=bioreactor metagenome TaxID=1076179 RepID=A0A645ETY3_9ZZZZ